MIMQEYPATPFTPDDLLDTIQRFRSREIPLLDFLDRAWSQIEGMAPQPGLDLVALQDHWTGIEIVYALASEAGQPALTRDEEDRVWRAVDALAAALGALK